MIRDSYQFGGSGLKETSSNVIVPSWKFSIGQTRYYPRIVTSYLDVYCYDGYTYKENFFTRVCSAVYICHHVMLNKFVVKFILLK